MRYTALPFWATRAFGNNKLAKQLLPFSSHIGEVAQHPFFLL